DFQMYRLVRVSGKGIRFDNVDFRYTIVDTCYFRNCVFNNCDFTGCRFIASNFRGATFEGCKFEYAVFERTEIPPKVLSTNCPGYDNLTLDFARKLRKNYESLGEKEASDKAFSVELAATRRYLYKASFSGESYYRSKYKGFDRFRLIWKWIGFWFTDLVLGNGQKVSRPFLVVLLSLVCVTLFDFAWTSPRTAGSLWRSLIESPAIFFGIATPATYPHLIAVFIYV
uniref:pentapeptide repeat-containing protein n=1 Tax=Stieleria mannarensis TaxID=2755585 RepID=UPI0016022A03